jgi:hypothetical protein
MSIKCFFLWHDYKPIGVSQTGWSKPITFVALKCQNCRKITVDRLDGVHLTLEQVNGEYK